MCKTIKQRVKFSASPATIYDLLADSRKHSAVTGRKATISRKVGGMFSASGNDVSGVIVDLVPGERIVQAWRHRRFPDGIFSMAAVTLTLARDAIVDVPTALLASSAAILLVGFRANSAAVIIGGGLFGMLYRFAS